MLNLGRMLESRLLQLSKAPVSTRIPECGTVNTNVMTSARNKFELVFNRVLSVEIVIKILTLTLSPPSPLSVPEPHHPPHCNPTTLLRRL